MFDPDYDPVEKLEIALKNQQELAKAWNSQIDTMNQLLHQNQQLNALLKQVRIDIHRLQADVEELKSRPLREIVNNTNYGNH